MQERTELPYASPEQGLPRTAAICAAQFLAIATGYVMSLGAFTFDIVVPAFFVWALLSGLLLATSRDKSKKKIFLDCAGTSAAFSISPFVFGTLRGLLAAQAGEIPNDAMVFGYGVLNLDAGFLGSATWFVMCLILMLFTITFALVLLATFGATAMESLALRIFRFGPHNIDITKVILLKVGAVVVVVASGVLAVASLSKSKDKPLDFIPKVPSIQVGTLTLDGPERGRVKGMMLLPDGREFDVLIPVTVLGDLVSEYQLEQLTTCGGDTEGRGRPALRCEDTVEIENVEIQIASVTRVYGTRLYILGAAKRLPKVP